MQDRLLFTAAAPFESARTLGPLQQGHRPGRLHGHGFVANVRAAIAPGWADFPGGEVHQLRERLAHCVAPLDYQLLNEYLDQPTDENLARWVWEQLDLAGIQQVGVQSTRYRGADLERKEQAHIWRRYGFEAAHWLPNVAADHKCRRMHGHGFEVSLHGAAAPGRWGSPDSDLLCDQLDRCWAPIQAEFHQACLNDIPGLENPTSELIASAVWQRVKPLLPELSWVTVRETPTCGAHFDGRHYRIWTELSLDSAVRMRRAPEGDRRRRIHGHTYRLRLHLNAALDDVLGWTIDFGDVKERFKPAFIRLDHQPLYELTDIEDNDAATLARWVKQQVVADLPELDRIDLMETRGCGAILAWGQDQPALPV